MANGVRQTTTGVVTTSSGVAQTVVASATEIDTFETDMSEYTSSPECQVVDEANVTPSAQDGTTMAESTTTDFGAWWSTSGSGLNYYPSAGDVFRIWLRFEDNSDASYAIGFIFGFVDSNNYYRVLHEFDGDTFLQETTSGTFSTLASGATYNPSSGEWFELEAQWPADPSVDPIIIEAFDNTGTSQGSIQSTHASPHTGSGVGQLHNGQNNAAFLCYWDWMRKTGTY